MVVSRLVHNTEFRERLLKHIESIISCEIDPNVVAMDAMHRKTRQTPIPHGMHDPAVLDGGRARALLQTNNEQELLVMSNGIDLQADKVNASSCFHNHTFTCTPKKCTSTPRCRLDMGRIPSSTSRLVTVEWSSTKDPTRPTERLTRVKVRDEWTCTLGKTWTCLEVPPVHTAGATVVQTTKTATKDTSVIGVLKKDLCGSRDTIVIITSDGAGFKSGLDLVIGTGNTATVVPGATVLHAEKTTHWCMRVKKICNGCKRLLEGGLYSSTEYRKSKKDRRCIRCCADDGRCKNCSIVSSCQHLSGNDIRLLHSTCQTCAVKNSAVDNEGDTHMLDAEVSHELETATSVTVQETLVQYKLAVDRVVSRSGVVLSCHTDVTAGGATPVDTDYLRALELLRCRNIMGYHGTLADRLIEMHEVAMWPPMVEAAGVHLYSVIVTSGAAQNQCEEYLNEHNLSNKVRYLSAGDLEVSHDRVRSVAVGDGDGEGYRILVNHVPRPTNSIRHVFDRLFGEIVLCLDEPETRKLMQLDFGIHQPKTIYMCKVELQDPCGRTDELKELKQGCRSDRGPTNVLFPVRGPVGGNDSSGSSSSSSSSSSSKHAGFSSALFEDNDDVMMDMIGNFTENGSNNGSTNDSNDNDDNDGSNDHQNFQNYEFHETQDWDGVSMAMEVPHDKSNNAPVQANSTESVSNNSNIENKTKEPTSSKAGKERLASSASSPVRAMNDGTKAKEKNAANLPNIGKKVTLWRGTSTDVNAGTARYHATVIEANSMQVVVKFNKDNATQRLTMMQYLNRLEGPEWINLLEQVDVTRDIFTQSTMIRYMVGDTCISPKGRAIADWYSFVFARENLQRALVDEYEKKKFKFHELNPPSDLVVIDPPPANDGTFRGEFMERKHDHRCITLHSKRTTRRSRYQAEASPMCSATLKCNTTMSVMVSMVSAKATMHYLDKYFQKDSCKVKDTLVLYHKCFQLEKKFPSRSTDSSWDPERRRANNLITKLLNKRNSSCEYTSTQVAQMLLGHNSRYCSHGTGVAFLSLFFFWCHRCHSRR